MAFSSQIRRGEFIIDESNAHLYAAQIPVVNGEPVSRGRVPRDYSREPFGALNYATAFDIPLIPRSEWPARIEEMERTKTRLSDLILQTYETGKPIKSLDQDGTNYCWCNAVITAIETIRLVAGEPYVKLSAASVAAPVKNFRNNGGWGGEALEYIVEHGVASAELWPPNAISRQYWTDAAKANAMLHLVKEWWDLRSRNFDQKMTLLLNRIPVPSGYNWWSHETCGFDPVMVGTNKFGSRERNSWSDSYGDRGFFILAESKSTPDDAVAPRSTLPSLT